MKILKLNRISKASDVLKSCEMNGTDAIADILCSIAKYDESGDGAGVKNECIEFVLDHIDCSNGSPRPDCLNKVFPFDSNPLINYYVTSGIKFSFSLRLQS